MSSPILVAKKLVNYTARPHLGKDTEGKGVDKDDTARNPEAVVGDTLYTMVVWGIVVAVEVVQLMRQRNLNKDWFPYQTVVLSGTNRISEEISLVSLRKLEFVISERRSKRTYSPILHRYFFLRLDFLSNLRICVLELCRKRLYVPRAIELETVKIQIWHRPLYYL